MLDNRPYQSDALDKILHRKLQAVEGMVYSRDHAALKTVALVGTLLPDTKHVRQGKVTEQDLFPGDMDMLLRSFNALSEANIALHPEATFQIYNILPPVQSDYLLASLDWDGQDLPENDLTIIQYIPKKGYKPEHPYHNMREGFKNLSPEEIDSDDNLLKPLGVSHLHDTFHIWAESADRLGAKIVITHGGIGNEVTTLEFEGHPSYRTIIDSDSGLESSPQNLDSRHNMGVVMHKDCIQKYRDNSTSQSAIDIGLARSLD